MTSPNQSEILWFKRIRLPAQVRLSWFKEFHLMLCTSLWGSSQIPEEPNVTTVSVCLVPPTFQNSTFVRTFSTVPSCLPVSSCSRTFVALSELHCVSYVFTSSKVLKGTKIKMSTFLFLAPFLWGSKHNGLITKGWSQTHCSPLIGLWKIVILVSQQQANAN